MFLTTGSDMTGASASESLTGNMFSVADVISVLNLPAVISDYVEQVINSIFDLIWSSGIQDCPVYCRPTGYSGIAV